MPEPPRVLNLLDRIWRNTLSPRSLGGNSRLMSDALLVSAHTHAKPMSTPVKQKNRPALPDDNSVERYAKLTREGVFNLTPAELFWQARHRHLQGHGYTFRPRYIPGWKPSWIDTNHDPLFCEDSIMLLVCFSPSLSCCSITVRLTLTLPIPT